MIKKVLILSLLVVSYSSSLFAKPSCSKGKNKNKATVEKKEDKKSDTEVK